MIICSKCENQVAVLETINMRCGEIEETYIIQSFNKNDFKFDLEVCIGKLQRKNLHVEVQYSVSIVTTVSGIETLNTALVIGRLKK